MGMLETGSGMQPVVAENENLSVPFMCPVPVPVHGKDMDCLFQLELLQVMLMVGTMDNHFMDIGDGKFIRYHPHHPPGSVFLALADPIDFRRSKFLKTRAKRAHLFIRFGTA